MNKRLRCVAFCVLCIMSAAQLPLIAAEKREEHTPVPYTKEEFPLWQRELRRFEILSFGALPFVTLLSFWGYDMIRAMKHPKDPAYYPWPFKQSGKAVPLTQKEQLGVFLTAAGLSITIAVIDITYRAIKRASERKRLERENAEYGEAIQFIQVTTPVEEEATEKDLPLHEVNKVEPDSITESSIEDSQISVQPTDLESVFSAAFCGGIGEIATKGAGSSSTVQEVAVRARGAVVF